MAECGSFNSQGRGSLVLNQQSVTLGNTNLPLGRTVRDVFCDPRIFWCFDREINIPQQSEGIVRIDCISWDFARRASNHEVAALGERKLFSYDSLFPALVAECCHALQLGESNVLLMNDQENIFPFTDGSREGELLVALDRGIWTAARRDHPSTAYDNGDRFFRPA
jgi:hypothetical protein